MDVSAVFWGTSALLHCTIVGVVFQIIGGTMNIDKLIPRGAENAVPMVDLAKVSGLSERGVRKTIEQLRRNGSVICSNDNGYYLPDNLLELRDYISRMSKRAETTFLCLQSARALLRKFDGQMTLGGFFDE